MRKTQVKNPLTSPHQGGPHHDKTQAGWIDQLKRSWRMQENVFCPSAKSSSETTRHP